MNMKNDKLIKKVLSTTLAAAILTSSAGLVTAADLSAANLSAAEIQSSAVVTAENADYTINLDDMTCATDSTTSALPVYEDLDTFLTDYNAGTLPQIYITNFVFNGIGAASKISKDDTTGEVTTKKIKGTILNIHTTGSIAFSGTSEDTCLAVNTNDVEGDLNLILNGVNITSSGSTPAIMVYNKDITYNKCNVTIQTVAGTSNYLTGGKLKKTSTMTADKVSTYTAVSSIYSDTDSQYYYVYTADEVSNLIFAQQTATMEKVAEESPYTYYKYSGAVSSDIDLTFQGDGYLEVSSTGDEAIEGKGDINFVGGTGDYKILAYDDGINASTDGTDIAIDVNSMYVEVNPEADEGDGIDSNGTIHISGGQIYAFAHPTSQDAGIDSNGTYINGGTIIATGNMADEISADSKQNYISLTFSQQQAAGTTISMNDSENTPVMAYTSGRTFTTLLYSSADLAEGDYSLYRDATVAGTSENGLYSAITSATDGIQQQWGGMGGGSFSGGGTIPSGDFPGFNTGDTTGTTTSGTDTTQGTAPAAPSGTDTTQGTAPAAPTGTDTTQGTAPAAPTGTDTTQGTTPAAPTDTDTTQGTAPAAPTDTDTTQGTAPAGTDTTQGTIPSGTFDGNFPGGNFGGNTGFSETTSKTFTLSASQHSFSNVTDYVASEEVTDLQNQLTEAQEELAQTQEQLKDAQDTLTTTQAKVEELTQTVEEQQKTIEELNTELQQTRFTASTVKISSAASRKKSQITVKVKKVTNASKYQIRYATSKTFKSSKSVTTTSTTKTLKKLKSGKKYYVKVRAISVIGGKTLKTSYSAVKTVKTK